MLIQENLLNSGENKEGIYGIWTTTHWLTPSQFSLLEIIPGTCSPLWARIANNTEDPSPYNFHFRLQFSLKHLINPLTFHDKITQQLGNRKKLLQPRKDINKKLS